MHYEVQEMYHQLLWRSAAVEISCTRIKAYICTACGHRPARLQAFSDVKFCRW